MADGEQTTRGGSTAGPLRLGLQARPWWHRNLDTGERHRIIDELALGRVVERWLVPFVILLTLSVVVAVMGLSADSPAVVIGAMLIAPLMNPVLALAASLSMSLRRSTLVSLAKVVVATAWCVAVAYLLSRVIPDSGALSGEIEARTRPDVRDLVVALAAGAAGSYATVRRDVSSALPGVAVAVALVPPLATVGITLEAGETDLALGALLLYATNLAAIVFAGVMVFIATGFVPTRRVASTALQLLSALAVTSAVVAIVAVPLFSRSARAVTAARNQLEARTIVDTWLNGAALDASVEVSGDRVTVNLSGFDAPPDDADLEQALQDQLGPVSVIVQWVRTERVTTTTAPVLSDDDRLLAQVDPIVRQWLAEDLNGSDYELEQLSVIDGVLRVAVAGSGHQPAADVLVDELAAELGTTPRVRIVWTERQTIVPGSTLPPDQVMVNAATAVVDGWAVGRGLGVESVTATAEGIDIVVAGSEEPQIESLLAELVPVVGPNRPVHVYFVERRAVTTTQLLEVIGGGVPAISGPAGGSSPTPTATTTTTGTTTAPTTTATTGG